MSTLAILPFSPHPSLCLLLPPSPVCVCACVAHHILSQYGELFAGDSTSAALLQILSGLPVILLFLFVLRGGLMGLEAPLLSLLGPRMSWQVCVCVCVLLERKGAVFICVLHSCGKRSLSLCVSLSLCLSVSVCVCAVCCVYVCVCHH